MDDSRIIELYFARDERAIKETQEKYGKLLRSIARGILDADTDCEECESDVYLRAWNSIPPEKPIYLSAYLARIARNLALNYARAKGRRTARELALIREELSDLGDCDLCDEIALRDAIRDFVTGLDQKRRRIFIQRYFYALSIGEIARECGLPIGSVKSILSRARASLGTYLTERGIYI
ncbi:MAG: sigma-70 family RNA polymerase sigma factor [Clostridia bacterium]|nr:sigma-70 family RNA polymerase sigma factor [Clostridia bacterium]